MRILAIDTATEACSAALWNDGTLSAHFEICPREHTQRILPLVQEVLTESGTTLSELDALAFGRGPGSFTGVRIGIGIAQGLALGAELPMIGVSTLATMAQGAWRKTGATRVLAAIDARMGEVYWAEYQRDEQGVWHGEETEAVLKPDAVAERLAQLSGEWATVGTGWQAWPDLAKASGLTLSSGEIAGGGGFAAVSLLPAGGGENRGRGESGAGLFAKRGGVEETSMPRVNLSNKKTEKRSRIMAGQKQGVRWLLAAAVAVALSGCVSVPDAIKGTSPTPQQDLVRVMNAPQLYVGQEARFGGKVVNVQNQQGKTRLEIATVPLDSGARPVLGEPSRGRIFADVNGFLDPVDFRGQLVTVVGPIAGVVDGKVGSTPYKFMLMNATGYKRWNVVQQVVMPPQPIDPWMLGPRPWGYGYGGWGWYNPGPAEVRNVVTE